MICAKRYWFIVLFLPLQCVASDLDSRLVESWKEAWTRVVDKSVSAYLQRAADGELSELGAKDQEMALAELHKILQPAVSWDALGGRIIETMTLFCGTETLNRMTPYFTRESDRSTIDPDLAREYAECAQAAFSDVFTHVAEIIESKRGDVSAVGAKYRAE